MFIATLIAAEDLAAADFSEAIRQMNPLCEVVGWSWIEEGRVADIRFVEDPDWARGVLDGFFFHADVIIQIAAHRRKKLLVADMDSTMITVECIDELADFAGLKPEVAAITERAMQGELDFEAALESRVRLLAGMPVEILERCREERVRYTPGARTLVQTMKAHGARCVLVSGGFTAFAEPVGAELGFDRVVANRLVVAEGRLTGEVERPIVGAQTKRIVLEDEMARGNLGEFEVIAVGDGANDVPMLQAAGFGVAFRGKPAAEAAADARVRAGDLTALLYAQGYRREEWVE